MSLPAQPPAIRHEAHFRDRVVRCYADRLDNVHDCLPGRSHARPMPTPWSSTAVAGPTGSSMPKRHGWPAALRPSASALATGLRRGRQPPRVRVHVARHSAAGRNRRADGHPPADAGDRLHRRTLRCRRSGSRCRTDRPAARLGRRPRTAGPRGRVSARGRTPGRRRGARRRHRGDPLHLGYHRAPEGRDAHASEHRALGDAFSARDGPAHRRTLAAGGSGQPCHGTGRDHRRDVAERRRHSAHERVQGAWLSSRWPRANASPIRCSCRRCTTCACCSRSSRTTTCRPGGSAATAGRPCRRPRSPRSRNAFPGCN